MFDAVSYIMGLDSGQKHVIVASDMTFVDDGEGNVTVVTEEVENND